MNPKTLFLIVTTLAFVALVNAQEPNCAECCAADNCELNECDCSTSVSCATCCAADNCTFGECNCPPPIDDPCVKCCEDEDECEDGDECDCPTPPITTGSTTVTEDNCEECCKADICGIDSCDCSSFPDFCEKCCASDVCEFDFCDCPKPTPPTGSTTVTDICDLCCADDDCDLDFCDCTPPSTTTDGTTLSFCQECCFLGDEDDECAKCDCEAEAACVACCATEDKDCGDDCTC